MNNNDILAITLEYQDKHQHIRSPRRFRQQVAEVQFNCWSSALSYDATIRTDDRGDKLQ